MKSGDKHHLINILKIFLILFISTPLFCEVYNHAYVSLSYDAWNSDCSGTVSPILYELHLRGGFQSCSDGGDGDFCQQAAGNPKVVKNSAGEWLIFVDGQRSVTLSDSYNRGDAVYPFTRLLNGHCDTVFSRCIRYK